MKKSKVQKVGAVTDLILTEAVTAINEKLGPNTVNKKAIIDRLVIEYTVNGLYQFFVNGEGRR